MKLTRHVANPGLAALIEGAGFPSAERFADAVNRRAWDMYGLKVCYDHVRVKRWLRGSACQYPEVVAAVLSDAWGVPVPVGVIWPHLREGEGPVPAHLQAWVAARTLEDLGVFLRSDMLTRRDALAGAVRAATGAAFVEPLTRWLGVSPTGLGTGPGHGTGRIGMETVTGIEEATRHFEAVDSAVGGGLLREAAAGLLKRGVDLARDASYPDEVGTRLLTAIARLSQELGWMSFDVGMHGPAQAYFVYGLQAAHEAGDEAGRVCAAATLSDMARQLRALGHPGTGVRLLDLALERLPADRRRFNGARAMLWSLKSSMFAPMGLGYLPEVRNAANLSLDLFGQSRHDEPSPVQTRYWTYTGEAEMASSVTEGYRDLARVDARLAGEAERYALQAVAHRADGYARSKVFDLVALAQARFLSAEPEQACDDGEAALALAGTVATSKRVNARLRDLVTDSGPYRDRSRVRDLRDAILSSLAAESVPNSTRSGSGRD
jgi:hypothetical protein